MVDGHLILDRLDRIRAMVTGRTADSEIDLCRKEKELE